MARTIPRNSFVIVEILQEEALKQNAAGIYIPTRMGDMFDKARIVRIGRGYRENDGFYSGVDDLQEGMLVLVKSGFRKDLRNQAENYVAVEENGRKLAILNQQDIFCILEEDAVPALKITNEQHAAATDSGTGAVPHDASDDMN